MADGEIDFSSIFNELGTRISDLEERHGLLKEKVLLLGQSLLKQGDELNKELSSLKEDVRESRMDLERMKESIASIIQESENFARKDDIKIFEKQMQFFEPLKFVRTDEVEKMIHDALKKHHKK